MSEWTKRRGASRGDVRVVSRERGFNDKNGLKWNVRFMCREWYFDVRCVDGIAVIPHGCVSGMPVFNSPSRLSSAPQLLLGSEW